MSDRREDETQAPGPREITLLYRMDPDGGFMVGNTATGFASYAYPTSESAERAEQNPEGVALAMDRANHDQAERWIRDMDPRTPGVFPTIDDRLENARIVGAQDAQRMAALEAGRDDGSTKTLQIVAQDYHRTSGDSYAEARTAAMLDAALDHITEQAATGPEKPVATWREAREIAQRNGYSLTKQQDSDEYRLAPRTLTGQAQENRAYYSNDPQDAVGTMRADLRWQADQDRKIERVAAGLETPPSRWGHPDDYKDEGGTLEIPQQEQATMSDVAERTILYRTLDTGGFIVGDRQSKTTAWAHQDSTQAKEARQNPERVASMLAAEMDRIGGSIGILDDSRQVADGFNESQEIWEYLEYGGATSPTKEMCFTDTQADQQPETGLPGIDAPAPRVDSEPRRRAEDTATANPPGPMQAGFLRGIGSQDERAFHAAMNDEALHDSGRLMPTVDAINADTLRAFDRPAMAAVKALDAGRVMTPADLAARLRETPAETSARNAQYGAAIMDRSSQDGREDA